MDFDFDGDCDGVFGFGWIFPAFIVGKLIADAFGEPRAHPWPQPRPPVQPQPKSPQNPRAEAWAQPADIQAALRCQHCEGELHPGFAFCPHCGKRVSPVTCRYCNQTLKPGMAYCPHCGGPTR